MQEVADQLAGAIEAEIRELGGGQLLEEAAALHIHKAGAGSGAGWVGRADIRRCQHVWGACVCPGTLEIVP